MSARRLISRLKPLGYAASAYGRRAVARAGMAPRHPPVGIVIERADWAIRWWGSFTAEEANKQVARFGVGHHQPLRVDVGRRRVRLAISVGRMGAAICRPAAAS